ncbi:DUF222 domain-containing protein [Rathayibacter sp. YIM 133350]|uniref:HNH endonuclease signature motif containing protein n=1 Tax=Rathayibacter sp. YIM 133350 TaxID=3131992 RepID=UPI00307E62BC
MTDSAQRLDEMVESALAEVMPVLSALLEAAPGATSASRDDELLMGVASIETLGRLVDSLRVIAAGEVAHRSRRSLGTDGLAARRSCSSHVELLQRITRQSGASMKRLSTLGLATRRRSSLTGTMAPPLFPAVSGALEQGLIGTDAAAAIARTLGAVTCGDAEGVAAAERELVAAALGVSIDGSAPDVPGHADDIRLQAEIWRQILDADGLQPAETASMKKRGFEAGTLREGLFVGRYALMPEVHAKFKRLLDAYLAPRSGFRPSDDETAEPDENAAEPSPYDDDRSRDQARHDAFAAMVDAAARAADAPSVGGAAPTVLVSCTDEDLRDGEGAGWIDGMAVPISFESLTQFACAGGTQRVRFDEAGRIIELGSPDRCFTAQQRRAIGLRDGGCIIPGCGIPISWCEIHHVQTAADHGPTHTDNGVLLCWYHHRMIEQGGWYIEMRHGVPYVLAPPWIDPSRRWRRAAQSPTRMADRLRRRRGSVKTRPGNAVPEPPPVLRR